MAKWNASSAKFYGGKTGESPWNNDLHQKHTLENEDNFYHMLSTNSLKFERDRNPFNLTLEEVVNDESAAKKFAVRQTNGIQPRCSHRSEPNTGRRVDRTVALMRQTNMMLSSAIPELQKQVQSTNQRLVRLERRRTAGNRLASAPSQRSRGSDSKNGPPEERATYMPESSQAPRSWRSFKEGEDRSMYVPEVKSTWRSRGRAQSAASVRSGMSSVLDGARDVLGKATNVLEARPQTAKTTKTVLSHRVRHGWNTTLRDGDIVKHAGGKIPKRSGYSMEADHSTGLLRRRPVKMRPSTAPGVRQPSCRRMPGFKAPYEDYGPNAPGEGSEDPSFYIRPEDLNIPNPGHQ